MPERYINFDLNKVFTATSTDVPAVGERYTDPTTGNQYVFLQGLADTALGSWVTYDEAGVTALLAANAIGPVAIAQAATVADTKGWYLVYGSCSAKVAVGFADNGNLYATATAGEADDAIVAGDRVKNAIGRSAVADGVATVQVWTPFMDDGLAA